MAATTDLRTSTPRTRPRPPTGNDRIVVYSLALDPQAPRTDLVWQFTSSISTLRAHNADIAVVLFVWGHLPPELAAACHDHGVMVHDQGSYAERLTALCPNGGSALAEYPLLHRFLNFSQLRAAGAQQILICDCDTIFFDDVATLFDRYAGVHIAAREEVHSSRSPQGPDPDFLDQPLVERIAAHEGVAFVAPFNLGVVLFDGAVAEHLATLEARFVDYAWRFVLGMLGRPPNLAGYGEFKGLGAAGTSATAADLARALPYPSQNHWILDEISLWLTLGHVPGLRSVDLDRDDVAENGEFADAAPGRCPWTVCHYYTQNTERITQWLRAHALPGPG